MDKITESILAVSSPVESLSDLGVLINSLENKKIICFSLATYLGGSIWEWAIKLNLELFKKAQVGFIGLEVSWDEALLLNELIQRGEVITRDIISNNIRNKFGSELYLVNLLNSIINENKILKIKIRIYGILPPDHLTLNQHLIEEINIRFPKDKLRLLRLLQGMSYQELFKEILSLSKENYSYLNVLHYSFYLFKKSLNKNYDEYFYFKDTLDSLLDLLPENKSILILTSLAEAISKRRVEDIFNNFGKSNTFHLSFLFSEVEDVFRDNWIRPGLMESYCQRVSYAIQHNHFYFLLPPLEKGSPFYDIRLVQSFDLSGIHLEKIIPSDFFQGIFFFNKIDLKMNSNSHLEQSKMISHLSQEGKLL